MNALPCGHHESNLVKTAETGTEFCRQCDIESRCRDAETREMELSAELAAARAERDRLKQIQTDEGRLQLIELLDDEIGRAVAERDALQADLADAERVIRLAKMYVIPIGGVADREIETWLARRAKPTEKET